MKQKQARVTLPSKHVEIFNELTKNLPLPETAVLSLLVAASLEAIKRNGMKIQLPLIFEVKQQQN